jgi:hypothetical protein
MAGATVNTPPTHRACFVSAGSTASCCGRDQEATADRRKSFHGAASSRRRREDSRDLWDCQATRHPVLNAPSSNAPFAPSRRRPPSSAQHGGKGRQTRLRHLRRTTRSHAPRIAQITQVREPPAHRPGIPCKAAARHSGRIASEDGRKTRSCRVRPSAPRALSQRGSPRTLESCGREPASLRSSPSSRDSRILEPHGFRVRRRRSDPACPRLPSES